MERERAAGDALTGTPLGKGSGGEPPELGHEDMKRLGKQRAAVKAFMISGRWHTLGEIEDATGHPQASISARLRDFRRPKHGGHTVERRLRSRATWEYRLILRFATQEV